MHMMQRWMQQTNNSHDENLENMEGVWSSSLGVSHFINHKVALLPIQDKVSFFTSSQNSIKVA